MHSSGDGALAEIREVCVSQVTPGSSLLPSCHEDGSWLWLSFWKIDSSDSSEEPGQECPEILHLFSTVHKSTPSVPARCHWGLSNLLLACFKIDFYLLENLKAPAVQNLWHSCTTDALDKLPMIHHASEHTLLESLPCFCHQWVQPCWFGEAFLSPPKLAHCAPLLKKEVLSQVTRHSKLSGERCSLPMEKNKNLQTQKSCAGVSRFLIRIQHHSNTSRVNKHHTGKRALVKKRSKGRCFKHCTWFTFPFSSHILTFPLTLRSPCPVEQVKPHLPTAVCVRAHEAHVGCAASQHHKWLF